MCQFCYDENLKRAMENYVYCYDDSLSYILIVVLFQTLCREAPLTALSACVSEFLLPVLYESATVHPVRCWHRHHSESAHDHSIVCDW